MNRLDQALALAAKGFHVFPLVKEGEEYTDAKGNRKVSNGKIPAISDFPNRATRDEKQIRYWFSNTDRNIGISTTRFGEDKCLLAVDVDNKKGKNGDATILELELDGYELPETFEQATPTGGRHMVYVADVQTGNTSERIGRGIDTRGLHGYIVGPGSEIAGKHYHQINGHGFPVPAPGWLVTRLGEARSVEPRAGVVLAGVDGDRALARGLEYLKTAPVSVEGEGGDMVAYKVAAKLKDLGLDSFAALRTMLEHWNEGCQPPWPVEELSAKVDHAYRYGKEPVGSSAPEAAFPKVETPDVADEGVHPFDVLNKSYAYVIRGDHIIWETEDADGVPMLAHLNTDNFYKALASKTIEFNGKVQSLPKAWMSSEKRRTFDGFVFAPERTVSAKYYNLWRGFSVRPVEKSVKNEHVALDMFKEHALKNVCNGNAVLCQWLLGYFAHMIQRPWEKPLVALVFKGRKGTGKNALVERVGSLLGRHFMVTSKRRHVVGQFNGHLEACLCLTLDEAFWSGDKEGEGVLKDLITGAKHNVEHKGKEIFEIKNLTRVIVLGNEEWLVPATHDERRFAVFNVGDGRRQDRAFFQAMREGMERGGYAHLLRYLLDFDLTGIDVNAAPATAGLIDQKHASLEPVQEWWLDCLESDQLHGSSYTASFPDTVPHTRLFEAFTAWARSRNIRSRLPAPKTFMATLNEIAPKFDTRKPRSGSNGEQVLTKFNPGLAILRADWEAYIGGPVTWTD